jgi:hypothetical protein
MFQSRLHLHILTSTPSESNAHPHDYIEISMSIHVSFTCPPVKCSRLTIIQIIINEHPYEHASYHHKNINVNPSCIHAFMHILCDERCGHDATSMSTHMCLNPYHILTASVNVQPTTDRHETINVKPCDSFGVVCSVVFPLPGGIQSAMRLNATTCTLRSYYEAEGWNGDT